MSAGHRGRRHLPENSCGVTTDVAASGCVGRRLLDIFCVRSTMSSVNRTRVRARERVGAFTVSGAAFAAMAFQLIPTNEARAAVLALAPLVAWLASPDVVANGGCPNCYARSRHQERRSTSTRVEIASRAQASSGNVSVITGWDVITDVETGCSRCGSVRRTTDSVFVGRDHAASAAEAIVLARPAV